MDAVCRENLGIVVEWRLDDGPSVNTHQFLRVFWSFEPSIKVAYECQPRKFNRRMERIGRVSVDAEAWLRTVPLEKWALAHDRGKRFGLMTTNFSEVFNNVPKGARNLPRERLLHFTT